MLFTSRRPAAPLDEWIESIWLCRNDRRPRALERVLPSGAAQLIVNLAEDETRVYEESAAGLVCQRSPGLSSRASPRAIRSSIPMNRRSSRAWCFGPAAPYRSSRHRLAS